MYSLCGPDKSLQLASACWPHTTWHSAESTQSWVFLFESCDEAMHATVQWLGVGWVDTRSLTSIWENVLSELLFWSDLHRPIHQSIMSTPPNNWLRGRRVCQQVEPTSDAPLILSCRLARRQRHGRGAGAGAPALRVQRLAGDLPPAGTCIKHIPEDKYMLKWWMQRDWC
jgi:hypothetical protein